MTTDLFPDLPAAEAPRRARPQAGLRLRLELELPDGTPPPAWLADALEAMVPRRAPVPAPPPPKVPAPVDTVGEFVAAHLVPRRGSTVTLAAAWLAYRRLCVVRGWLSVSRNRFAQLAVREVHERYALTPSHDVKEAGAIRRGFRHLALQGPTESAGRIPTHSGGELGERKGNTSRARRACV